MDRRKFLGAMAAIPIVVSIPEVGWSATLPCSVCSHTGNSDINVFKPCPGCGRKFA